MDGAGKGKPTGAGRPACTFADRDARRLFLYRAREAVDEFVPALHGVVQRLLRGFLVRPHRFELLVDDVADLHEVAEADTARIVRRLDDHLLYGNVRAG